MLVVSQDLQTLMDEAKHGVIYFSMGSNLKSADMSTSMKQSLLKIFGKLKQQVIWKFEEDLEGVPSNIHLVKWAPQQSILSELFRIKENILLLKLLVKRTLYFLGKRRIT